MAIVADRIRAHLDSRSWQRFHCALIVTVAGAAAFVASRLLLRLALRSMTWRYALAALAGYGAFLLMIRLWVVWKASRLDRDDRDAGDNRDDRDAGDRDAGNVRDAPIARVRGRSRKGSFSIGDLFDGDISLPTRGGGRAAQAAMNAFRGGQSGGGGASMSFESPPHVPVSVGNVSGHVGGGKGGGFSLDIDGDDLFWLIVALTAACAGVAAVSYVVWVAPSFLGDAAVNAAVAGKVYHGMQRRDSSHWTEDQFRRTVLPAVIVVASASAVGYAFSHLAPEAVTIGAVWQHLAGKYGL
jgi:hypothetical protein